MTQVTSLESAAASVYERIRLDKERASPRVLPMLEVLEEHLFSKECNVNFLKRSAGIRDNSVPIKFHAELDLTPKAYLQECRMKTAVQLLRETSLKVWEIGDLVGFSSLGTFSKAFVSWSGVRPTSYRKQHQASGSGNPRAVGSSRPCEDKRLSHSEGDLKAALAGRLDPAAALQLIQRLLSLYPPDQTHNMEDAECLSPAEGLGS